MHFLLMEYSFRVFLCRVLLLSLLRSGMRSWVLSELELSRPPVEPMGARKMETSMQEGLYTVEPVHRHFPLMQTPFLLQW